MNLEQELRRALTRKDPSSQFADRVRARVGHQPAAGVSIRDRATAATGDGRARSGGSAGRSWADRTKWTALAAAATIVLAVVGLQRHASHTRAAEAERINREVRVALQIASEQLNKVQEKVANLGPRP